MERAVGAVEHVARSALHKRLHHLRAPLVVPVARALARPVLLPSSASATAAASAASAAATAAAVDDGALGGGSGPATDRFLAGLRDYLRRHALRAASSAELFDALQPHAAAFEEQEEAEEGAEGGMAASSSTGPLGRRP